MSGQWKPGDVGIIGNAPAFYVNQNGDRFWMSPIGTHWRDVDPIRPLVVIDPEDREQGERLARAIHDAIHKPGDFDSRTDMSREVLTDLMQSALREFANPTPPRPEEPTGLYARIEDSEGRVWVRTATQASVWRRESVNTHGYRYLIPKDGCDNYADIAAVRVLSEGVRDE